VNEFVIKSSSQTTSLHTLRRILNPQSVALVGASSKEDSLGNWFLQSLVKGGFQGSIFPVNPRGGKILGLHVFEDLGAVPNPVDLGILAIASEHVPASLRACAGKGMAGVIVAAGGFAETGKEGRTLQKEIVELVRTHNLRLIGPNTIGVINTAGRLNASFSREMSGSTPGSIAVISQSGSVCETLFFRCRERGFGFSTLISSGNEADLDLCDYLEYLIEDPATRVIALYVEQIKRPRRFMELARSALCRKPIVMFRTGRTTRGRVAASSHTGALAGNDLIQSGLHRQLGLIEARSYQSFVDSVIGLAGERYPEGNRLAVLTGPGAPGVATCDAAVEAGLLVEVLEEGTCLRLREILPGMASWQNPVDMTGAVATNPLMVPEALQVILGDHSVDGVILIFGALLSLEGLDRIIGIISGQSKPVLAVIVASLTENRDARALIQQLGREQIPSFFTPEQAVESFKILWEMAKYRNR